MQVENGLYKVGSKSPQVKILQEILNSLGYPCGTPDGVFGKGTEQAVKNFQKDNGLISDGIFGNASIKAINDKMTKSLHKDFSKTISISMPRISAERIDPLSDFIKSKLEVWSHNRIALFLAQIGHESNDLNTLRESLNYTTKALQSLFGRHRISLEETELYGRNDNHPANQEAIANIIYGGDFGIKNLGNTEKGDGWNFRGRGAIQLTGRANYTKCSIAIGVDLLKEPDLLADDFEICLKSAAWFFDTYAKAEDLETNTKQINGGFIGIEDRLVRYERTLKGLLETIK